MAALDQRRALLVAAVGFARLRWCAPVPPVALLLSRWLDSWRGLGVVLAGMTAQGFNVELKEFPEGWRANFYPVGIAQSVVAGSAYDPTPWGAVQRAAWARREAREAAESRTGTRGQRPGRKCRGAGVGPPSRTRAS